MTQAPATPELVERLEGLLVAEDRMHPIGCATWIEEVCVTVEEAADALEAQQARIAELEAERDEARDIVAWCNNSLFGSHSYFTAASGKTASEAIEGLKAGSHEQWRRAEASQALADRYEKALRVAERELSFAVERMDRRGGSYEAALTEVRQALSSQGRHEGGEG